MSRDIQIRDVGPVERLTIPIPEGGGLVVLRGRNGTGKSHSLQAVGALVGGKGRPVSRDGSIGASIEGLGARLTVGRRTSHSGEVEVQTLEGEDPSLLVDPGMKDQAAADTQRLKALLRLSRATVEVEDFANLVGSVDRLRELCRPASLEPRGDVPSMVSAIKRDLEAAARAEESASENAFAKADGVRAALEGFGDEGERKCPSTEAARAAHTAAVREQAALEARRDQNQQLLDASREAKDALAQLGDGGTRHPGRVGEETEENRYELAGLGRDGEPDVLSTARELMDATRSERDRLRLEVDRQQRDFEDAKREVEKQERAAAKRTRLTATREALKHEGAAISQRASLERAVDASSGASAITDSEIADAGKVLMDASNEVDAWVLHDKTRSMREEVEGHDTRGKAAADEGALLRSAAHGTEGVLLAAVRSVCGDDMEIQDGRLYVSTDRGRELFCELSPGERWRRALDIAVNAVGHKGLLVIRQEAYEAMDPLNRQEVAAHAQSLGVVVLTAECDEGEIRAEVECEVARA